MKIISILKSILDVISETGSDHLHGRTLYWATPPGFVAFGWGVAKKDGCFRFGGYCRAMQVSSKGGRPHSKVLRLFHPQFCPPQINGSSI